MESGLNDLALSISSDQLHFHVAWINGSMWLVAQIANLNDVNVQTRKGIINKMWQNESQ